jgi:hypothetical protein
MAALNAIETARELISYAVVTNKDGLIKLLDRNGIQMPTNPSDNEVTVAILMANSKSGVFRNELQKYLASLVPEVSEYASFLGSSSLGFTGTDDFSFTAADGFYNADGDVPALKLTAAQQKRVTATNPTGKSKVGVALQSVGNFFKTNVLTPENINAGIQIGLTSIANKTQSKQNQVNAEALQLQNYQDTLRQQLPNAAKKSNTMLYVWIGVGVLAVGVLGFVLYKQYKK